MKLTARILFLTIMLATTAFGRDLPAYYPEGEMRRAGEIDAVYMEDGRIVIDDISYPVSDDAIVHAPNAYSVSKNRLRPGTRVAFRVGQGGEISNFWLLPRNYDARNRR